MTMRNRIGSHFRRTNLKEQKARNVKAFNCSRREAIFVNVCVFVMQNFCLTGLTFRVTVTPLTFCVSRDLKFSLNHNFEQLNSIGGNLIIKSNEKCAETGAIFGFKS